MIADLLKTKHDISISLGNLERRLQDAGLTRRSNYTPINTVRAAISEELRGSGHLLGYRAMWQILQQKQSLVVRRDDVMRLMAELDPCGKENAAEDLFEGHIILWDLTALALWALKHWPKNDVAELWEDQQRPSSYCSDVR